MSKWNRQLSEELANIGSLFHPNELAYLALTQKVEHAVRDRLAFALHRKLIEGDSLLVCREWNRIDLALIQDSSPLVLLEVKAQYTFDILKAGVPHSYPELLLQDVQKIAPRCGANTEVFTLLLATHPYAAPDTRYRDAVKYYSDVVRYAKMGISLEQAEAEISKRLVGHPRAATGEIRGGNAFGVPVSVAYWLFGPYPNTV